MSNVYFVVSMFYSIGGFTVGYLFGTAYGHDAWKKRKAIDD